MCWHLLYNYEVKLTGLTEVVGLFIFSKIGSGDKIVCVKRPGVWGMIHISRWHLCYNGSFTAQFDMTPGHNLKNIYLEMNVQTDQTPTDRHQQFLWLWDKLGCDLVTWAKGIRFQAASIISQVTISQ